MVKPAFWGCVMKLVGEFDFFLQGSQIVGGALSEKLQMMIPLTVKNCLFNVLAGIQFCDFGGMQCPHSLSSFKAFKLVPQGCLAVGIHLPIIHVDHV